MRPGTRKAVRRMVHRKPPRRWPCGVVLLVGAGGTFAGFAVVAYGVWEAVTS